MPREGEDDYDEYYDGENDKLGAACRISSKPAINLSLVLLLYLWVRQASLSLK